MTNELMLRTKYLRLHWTNNVINTFMLVQCKGKRVQNRQSIN